MKTLKMSLTNIRGKMSRIEMKNIMAGFDLSENEVSCGIWCPNGGTRISLPDCSRSSAAAACGCLESQLTGATCTCG